MSILRFVRSSTQMRRTRSNLKALIVFKIKGFIAMLPYHAIVMGGVAIFALIFNKWIEAFTFLVAFFSLRYKFPETFHAEKIFHCMVITNAMFITSITICPSSKTYIFGSLLFGFLDSFVLWYIQSRETIRQDKETAERNLAAAQKLLEQYENPLSEFKEKCRKVKLSKRDTEIAIKYFVEHQTPKEIWNWLCDNKEYDYVEWDSVYQLLWRIGRKINKK